MEDEMDIIFCHPAEKLRDIPAWQAMKMEHARAGNDCREKGRECLCCEEENKTEWWLFENLQESIGRRILHPFDGTDDAATPFARTGLIETFLQCTDIIDANRVRLDAILRTLLLRSIGRSRDDLPILTRAFHPQLIENKKIGMYETFHLSAHLLVQFRRNSVTQQLQRKPPCSGHLPEMPAPRKEISMCDVAGGKIHTHLSDLISVTDNRGNPRHEGRILT